jgi:acyl-CoA synthetase (AMP-forming)/AMP-acid ligase II
MEVPRRPGYSLTVDRIAKSSLARYPTREIVYRVTAGGDRIERYDYSKAFERVNTLANALSALGVRRGDRIATLDWNTHCCPPPRIPGRLYASPERFVGFPLGSALLIFLSDSPS